MRIAIDCRKLGDYGIGTYIRGLIGALSRLDGDETYIALGPLAIRPLLPASFEHQVVEAGHYSIRELFAVARAIRESRADLFHAPHYVVPFTAVPVVVTIHDLIHLHQPQRNPMARIYARWMLGRAVAKARTILTVSQTVAAELREELGVEGRRIVVALNGIDERFRAPTTAEPESRAFLFVGNDKPHKGVETLVDAFRIARATDPSLHLRLAGGAFERFSNEAGVERLGFVSDETLQALYRNAIALVQPSEEEGFGLPAAEAMASGAAVITSDAAALLELTGDAALHFVRGSKNDLASAMLRVSSDTDLRHKLAARGIERASALTWKRCAELTRDAYAAAMHSANV